MPYNKKIEHKVRETISRYKLIDENDRIIVAVSGGPDSVCLLHMLHAMVKDFSLQLVVAHVDHGLRPSDDADETAFVRTLADSKDLPFETAQASLLEKEGRGSLEERARQVRYAFLESVRMQYGAQKIALGHNLNDQGETVIMRLLRGAGSYGLAGIPPKRGNRLIRPLISLTREEILHYLEEQGLSYKLDRTNLEPVFLRNRLRLDLMPLLLEYQPKLYEHLSRMAEILREESHYLDKDACRWIEKMGTLSQDQTTIPIPLMLPLPRALRYRIIRQLLMRVGKNLRRITWDHIEASDTLLGSEKPQATLNLPRGILVKKTYDTLVIAKAPHDQSEHYSYVLKGPGRVYIKETNQTLCLIEIPRRKVADLVKGSETAHLNAEMAQFPLEVRNGRPGDRFIPLGMKGRKKLKNYFIDEKIPSETRRKTPLLVSGDAILWVCGYRIDERYRVTEATQRILMATIRESPPI